METQYALTLTTPVHPSPTATPTILISSSQSPTPTLFSMTAIPTLPVEEQEAYLLDLIKANGDCELPCFLGIQPGESQWEELRKIDGPTYYRERYVPDEKGFLRIPFYVNREKFSNFDLVVWGSGNIIENIMVDARLYMPDDPYHFPAFASVMQQYSMENILTVYGIPSRILINVQGQAEPESGTQASILIFYDNVGILIDFWFLDVVTQDSITRKLRTCPDYEHIHSIGFYLQNPNNKTPLERMIGDEDDYVLNYLLKPLNEITAMSIEEFYKIFVAADDIGCFDVP